MTKPRCQPGTDAAGIERVFRAPWEARAFALMVQLGEAGYFTPVEWAETLGQHIKAAQQRGDPDLGTTYYQHWLKALEELCVRKNMVAGVELDGRADEWRRAYLHTPHGRPVELSAAH